MANPQFPDTPEQTLILEAVRNTRENILVQALAGAAKTSTLVRIAQVLPGRPILSVAFNKRIADEMTERLPQHCVAKTLNAIGHRAWADHTGRRLNLDRDKIANIVRGLDLSLSERDMLREVFGDVVQLVKRAKLYGYVPDGRYDEAIHLIDRETLEEVFAEEEFDGLAWALLDEVLIQSINQAYNGTIDYDDQLYMTTLFGAQLPKFPLTLVDEAQDLSPLNHQMIKHLVENRRIIAVGDAFQSIYGFRGAVTDGMNVLRTRFQMREFRLSVSFRCPKAIIRRAHSRVPWMKWVEGAKEGMVLDYTKKSGEAFVWGPNLFPRGCAVICRNNAPLFSLGLKLLASGRAVTLRGFDVSKRLLKTMKEFGDYTMPQEELVDHLARWRQVKLTEGKLAESSIEDRYACMLVFARAAPTLGGAIAHAERLFESEGPIELLSGHKAKGLEWDEVFHLDSWRVPSKYATLPEEKEQELNLEYVITTRAKNSLTFIDIEDFDIELDRPVVREADFLEEEPDDA